MSDEDCDWSRPPETPPLTRDAPPIRGRIRAVPEDFRVEEIPAYEPRGDGDHVFVCFEKRELDTPRAVRRIAEALGSDPRDAGFAGLKDRRAVTTQWASFLGGDPSSLERAELEGIRVIAVSRHPHKLRTGHLRANRFVLVLDGADPGRAAEALALLERLAAGGAPSYFGAQRFGREGENLARARRWLVSGERPPRDRFQRKLLVSAAQSAIFNRLLAARLARGTLARAEPGDLMRKEDTGGLFVAELTPELADRVARFEISPTGPMVGIDMRWADGETRVREETALASFGLSTERLREVRKAGPGARRPYRIRPLDVGATAHPRGIELRMTLPPGAYATAILDEVQKGEVPSDRLAVGEPGA